MMNSILSEQTYQLNLTLKVKVVISQIHFSQIIYDDNEISSSNKFSIVF
jgi:hypothetical protein